MRRPAQTSSIQPNIATSRPTRTRITGSRQAVPAAPVTGQPYAWLTWLTATMTGTCHR